MSEQQSSAESAAGDRQISVMAALDPTEESDIDFLLDQIKNAPDRQAKRDAVRSFRKQMALVSCLIDTLPQSSSMASDDPTASKEWNDGCDFAMTQLCKFLDVEPSSVSWDAATETVEGDVSAVIGNILRAKFGEDWEPQCQAEIAK